MASRAASLYKRLEVPKEDWHTRAGEVIAFCHCLRVPAGKQLGKPLRLRPLQLEFVRAVYNPPREDGKRRIRQAYLSIARRNGKSMLAAALVLTHLVGPERKANSMLLSAANDHFQARVVYKAVTDMLAAQPDILANVKVLESTYRVVANKTNSVYMAISAEARTKLGVGPDVIIFDELGNAKNRDLYDVLISSQGSQDEPLFMAISTQAPNDEHFFSQLLDYAVGATRGEIPDPTVVGHVYATPTDCALDDPEGWKLSNPGLGDYRDLEEMSQAAAKAIHLPSFEATFRNLYLNQRVSAHAALFTPLVWDACREPPELEVFQHGPVFGGLDLSARVDLTALVLVARDANGQVHVLLRAWTPADTLEQRQHRDRAPYREWVQAGLLIAVPGSAIDLEYVAHEIASICGDWPVTGIAFDRWRIDLLAKEFSRIGANHVPLVEHGQGYKDMSPAIDSLEELVLGQRLRHGGHPVLRWAVANTQTVLDPAANRKLDKAKSTGRIDPATALTMAVGLLSKSTAAPFDVRALIG